MRHTYWMLALILMTLVGGCSKPDDETPPAQQHGRLPDDNVFSDQVRALEKAEGVQKTLDAAAAQQREAIERQERQ